MCQTVEKAAQRSCGISIPGDIQKHSGPGSVQTALIDEALGR